MADAAPPPGFVPAGDTGGPFVQHNGPVFARRDAHGVTLGFRVMPAHGNGGEMCHGGWLASFMDMLLPLGAAAQSGLEGHSLLTISMSLDFLAAAPVGSWVEGRADMLRRTKRLLFSSGIARIDGVPVLRGSGVFRIGAFVRPLPY